MGQGHCFVFFCKTFSLYSYKTLERYLLTDDFDTIKFSYLILTYVDLLYKTFQDNLQCTEHPFQGGVAICPVASYNFIGSLVNIIITPETKVSLRLPCVIRNWGKQRSAYHAVNDLNSLSEMTRDSAKLNGQKRLSLPSIKCKYI